MNIPFKEIILSLVIILTSILFGIIIEKIIIRYIKKQSQIKHKQWHDIILQFIKGFVLFLSIIFGLYMITLFIPLNEKIITFTNKLLLIFIIITVALYSNKLIISLIRLNSKQINTVLPFTSIFTNITKIVLFSIGLLIILHSIGITITPLLTALGVGGLAISLALQETLANFFAGINILLTKQFHIGDYIKLNSQEEGYIIDITWRNIKIRNLPNNIIVIPNSKFASTVVMNYHLPEKELAVLIDVGVSYNSDLEKVEQVTIEVGKQVMKEVTGGVPEFQPFIRYHTFDDFSINFSVILRGKEFVDQYLIKHEFVKRLHKRYKEENIEIPFPIRTVHLKEKS